MSVDNDGRRFGGGRVWRNVQSGLEMMGRREKRRVKGELDGMKGVR